jgi:photosynthesis system II assembly factor YCF48-like protein
MPLPSPRVPSPSTAGRAKTPIRIDEHPERSPRRPDDIEDSLHSEGVARREFLGERPLPPGRDGILNERDQQQAERGWAAGDQGTVLETKDGGKRWKRVDVETKQPLHAVHVADKGKVAAIVGAKGTILRLK